MAQGTTTRNDSMISTAHVAGGVVGGLVGGVVFGLMMQAFGMIPMVAMLVGSEAVAVGWVVHLAISAVFGAVFGLLAGARPMGMGMLLAAGAAYGLVLWVVGALVAMPARLGMDLFMINEMSLRSLGGHLVFGVILGVVVALLAHRPSWCMAEVDIFQDLSEAEMDAMSRAAPMRSFSAGDLLHTPLQQVEALFILKQGRVRVFRLSADGRALTTAILSPGTIFGEMVVVGQQMYDSYAEALEDVVVCVMDRAGVHRFLLGDARIAARIAETLGRRLARIESQWSDAVFKSVPERVVGALMAASSRRGPLPLGRGAQVNLTHEQVAELAGTSRETATRILGDYAREGLIDLGRGRIKILNTEGLARVGGD